LGYAARMEKETHPLRTLYPHLDEKQLREAAENIEQYLLLVLRIHNRVRADPESYARFRSLTEKAGTLCCTPPRSNILEDTHGSK
jgi:hypothetical protein